MSIITTTPREMAMPIPGLRLIENFISDKLHDAFVKQMHRGSHEENKGHFDSYDFDDYKAFDAVYYPLIQEIFAHLKQFNVLKTEQLASKKPFKLACSLAGYDKDGYIERHTDSTLLSTGTVMVVSFHSPIVVHFYSEKKAIPEEHTFIIPAKSMYSIGGEAREDWSHAILPNEDTFEGKLFHRRRRYALILTQPGPLYSGSELLDFG